MKVTKVFSELETNYITKPFTKEHWCVCRDVSGENRGGLSAAVDNILNLTCTEPAFEGLLPLPLDQGEETSTLFILSPLVALMNHDVFLSADPTHHPPHPSSQSSHPLPPHSSGQVGPLQDNPQ